MALKKLPLFVAIAASLAAPAVTAQGAQVYGRLFPYLNAESGSGATIVGTTVATLGATPTGVGGVGSIKGMAAGNSRIGVRGSEDIGGGIKAKYQIEGVVAVDNGNAAGFTWNRDGFVGLEGGFGQVRLGIMDTVFKDYGDTLGILGTSSGTPMSSSNMLRKPGFGTSNAARFHERRANSIRYDSPEVSGFQGGLQIATQENATATVGAAKTYSLGLKYDKGPFYVALAHEIHDNFYGGSAQTQTASMRNNGAGTTVTSKDKATQFTVEWRATKEHKFEFDVIKKSYNEKATVAGRFQSYSNTAYLIGMDNRWNDTWRTAAHYVKSDAGSCSRIAAACSTEGLQGSKLLLGAAYYLSRRTYLFGVYDVMTNGKSARFSANDFGTAAPGEDSRHFIAGITHSF